MTADNEQCDRIMKLAHQVFGEGDAHDGVYFGDYNMVRVRVTQRWRLVAEHVRALDMLEAALLVAQLEPGTWAKLRPVVEFAIEQQERAKGDADG